jgi:heptosyltransferase-2
MNRPPPASDSVACRRILVRGVNWLGDAVMSTPALLRLRERFLDAHIALLTPAKLKDLWQLHPAVNDVIPIPPRESWAAVGRKLRGGQYDLGLVLPNSPRSALELWWARIPRRLGYARSWRNWFLTQTLPTRPGHRPTRKRPLNEIRRLTAAAAPPAPPAQPMTADDGQAHQIHEYLHLVATLGANPQPLPPHLSISPQEVDAAVRKFNLGALLAADRLLLGLNPGAEFGPAKRWPVDRFIAATREVQSRAPCTWLLFGGVGDVELANQIGLGLRAQKSGVRNLAGQTSLRELGALFKVCRVLLTNDTGPMHLAAALGTSVVVPFGSTTPELTGPGLPGDGHHRLLVSTAPCAPCFRRECPIDFRCMNGIDVARVVEAVLDIVQQR